MRSILIYKSHLDQKRLPIKEANLDLKKKNHLDHKLTSKSDFDLKKSIKPHLTSDTIAPITHDHKLSISLLRSGAPLP